MKKLNLFIILLLLSAGTMLAQYTHSDLQDAIDAALPGDVITLNSGTYVISSQVNVNKQNLTIQGNSTILNVSGAAHSLDLTANGITIQNLEIIKTDLTDQVGIIWIHTNDISIKNNIVHGQFNIGDAPVSRAMVISGGISGLLIDGNTFYSLRQPAYISGPTLGVISNNFTYGTKGWVLEGGDVNFLNNTWDINVYDIAIIGIAPITAYTDIVAMSNANNGAVIEDQRVAPAVLSVVSVDASTAFSSDLGGKYHPYSSITPAITRVVNGGKILVAAGTYTEGNPQILINKSLSIIGENKITTIIKPAQNTSNTGDARAWILVSGGTSFNLKNFTLDGTGKLINIGIISRSAGTIEDNIFTNLGYNPSGPDYAGRAVAFYEVNMIVQNNELNNIGRIGLYAFGTGVTNAIFSNNIYTGKGVGNWLDYGIELEGGAHATITNNTIINCLGIASVDGSGSAGILATTYFAPGTSGLVNNNFFNNNSISIAVGYDATDVTQIVAHNNSFLNNEFGITSTAPAVNAEMNYWGTVIESEILAKIEGPIDYDPWIGKAEMLAVTQVSPTIYSFPSTGVKMEFSTLPSGGGNVTVQRFNEVPAGFPSGYTNVGMWLNITSTMTNYTFNVIVKVDVDGLSGFDETTTVMYYNSTTSTWVAVAGGTYLASDPAFGGHPSFSFTTNHFTPFTFINTPASAYDVYLSSSTSATAGIICPNTDWGITGYEPNDWDFTAPIELYIVPQVGTQFGACSITLEWDNTMFTLASVINDGIFSPWPLTFQQSQLGSTSRVTIDASRTDLVNFNTIANNYIAKVNFNLLKPGYGAVNFIGMDFRYFNGANPPSGVYVTGNNAQVKSYLGDVASTSPISLASGDGLVNFDDLSPWSSSYWSGVAGYTGGMTNYKVKYDVGPTTTNTVYGLPTVDAKIQFEDLVIFSMSYGLSASSVYPKLNAEPTAPVELQLGDPIISGNQTRVPLFVSGGVQNVRAMNLTFAGTFGKLVSVEKGTLLNELVNPVMVMSNVEGNQVFVDLAVFGANELGISNEGEVLTLIFEGNADIKINTANIRNILNGSMAVNISGSVETVPTEFALMQNYPNPFNPSTMINYSLPTQSMVEISVFNALGEKVATLVNELKEAGRYSVELNAGGFSSGIYFYQITANDFVSVKKMILMK